MNAVPLPVIPLNRMTQIVASRPAPQTQNRGRRRVRLGLLFVLIPPAAAGSPVRTSRGLGLLSGHTNTVAPSIYRLDAIVSAVSICGAKPGVRCHQHLSLQSQTSIHGRHPSSSSLQAQISSRWHRESTHRSGASSPPSRVPPSVCAGRGCFSEPPGSAVSWVGRLEPRGTTAAWKSPIC